MICEKCSKSIDDDSKFCTYCGENVQIKEKILEKQNTSTFKEFFYSHHGSIGRKEFFFRGFLPLTMILAILITIPNISISIFTSYFESKIETVTQIGFFKFLNYAVIVLYFFLFVIVSNVSIKRLHDTNKNGWWAMLNLVPIINLLLLLYLFFAPSRKDNIYGVKSEYNLDSTKILLSMFYICIIFIALLINGFTKEITQSNLKNKVQKNI